MEPGLVARFEKSFRNDFREIKIISRRGPAGLARWPDRNDFFRGGAGNLSTAERFSAGAGRPGRRNDLFRGAGQPGRRNDFFAGPTGRPGEMILSRGADEPNSPLAEIVCGGNSVQRNIVCALGTEGRRK